MDEIVPGLWRWTAPHPAWRPGAEPDSPDDWDELVACVLYECGDAVVFIDPLIPPDAASFWMWADSTSRARRSLPPQVRPVPLRGAAETMFWLPDIRTLVPGDRILGAPGAACAFVRSPGSTG
jgi:hypothetical protein